VQLPVQLLLLFVMPDVMRNSPIHTGSPTADSLSVCRHFSVKERVIVSIVLSVHVSEQDIPVVSVLVSVLRSVVGVNGVVVDHEFVTMGEVKFC